MDFPLKVQRSVKRSVTARIILSLLRKEQSNVLYATHLANNRIASIKNNIHIVRSVICIGPSIYEIPPRKFQARVYPNPKHQPCQTQKPFLQSRPFLTPPPLLSSPGHSRLIPVSPPAQPRLCRLFSCTLCPEPYPPSGFSSQIIPGKSSKMPAHSRRVPSSHPPPILLTRLFGGASLPPHKAFSA